MKRLSGNISGLKANQIRRLENLYRRRIPPEYIITPELSKDIVLISHEIRRQVGLLINRMGKIVCVIIGNHKKIEIPDISEYRSDPGRLKGLKCVHTHLDDEILTKDDLTDLSLLKLDFMSAITSTHEGKPHLIHGAHILPGSTPEKPYEIMPPLLPNQLDIGCLELIRALETELAHVRSLDKSNKGVERALLISVITESSDKAKDALTELEELSISCGIYVVDKMLQKRKQIDSRYLMGRGKLEELSLIILNRGISLIIFEQELNPSQMGSITRLIDIKVIDRTQLILDIFAQRAQSKEGKLQVELAQLKYLLPRLVYKNTAMSRLTGGIGGRGPGETKLEINRRRVRDRIARLEKSLLKVRKQRKQQKAKRQKKALPVISIIGYTNAGKSTLLNTLTKSRVLAEKRLFATLDPSSRRLKFPKDVEVILTDTVGFIENLPKDLLVAFRATLEELETATFLLHVIDISNPRFESQIHSVEKILEKLKLDHIPIIRALNKVDLVKQDTALNLCHRFNGIAISANKKSSLVTLTQKLEHMTQKLIYPS